MSAALLARARRRRLAARVVNGLATVAERTAYLLLAGGSVRCR